MTYQEVLDNAKKRMMPKCKVCSECNGLACKGEVPGVGGIGSGRAFTASREFFKSVKIPLDPIHEDRVADTKISLFGQEFSAPFFVAPIGGMMLNYTGIVSETEYAEAVVFGARDAGTLAFTGDGPKEDYFRSTLPVIKEAGGVAIATIKPWTNDKIINQIREIEKVGGIAFSVDVDSAALINLRLMGKPVTTKSVAELKELADCTKLPFIVKGILTPKAAMKCAEAGVYGVVVSSHGGRIMEDNPAPASMLPSICKAVAGSGMKIFVDGGIRSGADVFKCLALGADAVLIGRPYAVAAHGGGREGVKLYTDKVAAELRETMMMTDCASLADITFDKVLF